MQALGRDAELAGGLRPAQHQRGEQRDGRLGYVQDALDVVRVAHDARTARLDDQRQRAQRVNRRLHFGVGRLHERVAVVLLVAAERERVERQRIAVRDGALLLDEHADNARLERREARNQARMRRLRFSTLSASWSRSGTCPFGVT